MLTRFFVWQLSQSIKYRRSTKLMLSSGKLSNWNLWRFTNVPFYYSSDILNIVWSLFLFSLLLSYLIQSCPFPGSCYLLALYSCPRPLFICHLLILNSLYTSLFSSPPPLPQPPLTVFFKLTSIKKESEKNNWKRNRRKRGKNQSKDERKFLT